MKWDNLRPVAETLQRQALEGLFGAFPSKPDLSNYASGALAQAGIRNEFIWITCPRCHKQFMYKKKFTAKGRQVWPIPIFCLECVKYGG